MQKLGRIIIGAGVGTLLGILMGGNIEKFSGVIAIAVLAILFGTTLIFIAKNQEKTEELTSAKTCPNCGLSLSQDCCKCPKCNTIVK